MYKNDHPSRRLSFWEPLLNRIRSRLAGWSSKHLSFGGRLILLKSVMSSLSVYALSFFKAPTGIISSIESLFNCFFLEGSVDHRKIFWVDWNSVCRRKEVGGLGVRRIREFNLALLGKWCWRLLEDKDSLWFRVLSARYGVDEGRLRGGGREASEWWRVVNSLSREICFSDHVSRYVEDGRKTLFCSDVWCGGVSFRVRFSRLFDLSVFKGESVFEMSQLGWGEGGEAWRWRQRLFAWEVYCLLMLLCRLLGMTNGFGLWRIQMFSLFVVCIIFLPFNRMWSYQLMLLLFGIRMSLLRWWCLLGVCFGIDWLQRTIYSGAVLLALIPGCVWRGVTLSKRLIIYFYIVIFLVLFDT